LVVTCFAPGVGPGATPESEVKVSENPTEADEPKPESLARVRANIRRDRETIERVSARIVENLKLAVSLGAGAPDLAEDSGYTLSRVGQLVGGFRKLRAETGATAPRRRPRKQADEPPADPAPEVPAEASKLPGEPEGWGVQDAALLPERYRPGSATGVQQLLHAKGLVSDHYASTFTERATIFVDVGTGEWWSPAGKHGHIPWGEGTAAELLGGLTLDALATVERVFFVGRPGVTDERVRVHGSAADAARTWYLTDVPGWTADGHYLADDTALIGRWRGSGRWDGRQVEVQRAATWFGEGLYTARAAALAWFTLGRAVAAEFSGGVLLSSPATTGRDLWRRSISRKSEGFPVLSTELRELIQTTSGQGRRELVAPPRAGRIPLLTQYDMRLAYAALAWGMPVGAPTMVTGREFGAMDDDGQRLVMARRGRWLVRATVPLGWEHVGILPTPNNDGTWAWPSRPGSSFTSWCSASELSVARLHGWRVEILEGFHFAEGKPLNTWKDKLVRIYSAERKDTPTVVDGMVRAAARMMILATVGAFASRSHVITRSVPVTDNAQLPDDAPIREVGGMYVWEEQTERSEWMERTSHPEWSAEIWGRCRTRLLIAPTGTQGVSAGALHVPPGNVIGMRTDGITLAGDPVWPDDGAPGRYRLQGRMRGAFEWPATEGALTELKRQAEGALETGEMQ
jgi:hypothetical protein